MNVVRLIILLLCASGDTAIKAMLNALNSESHSTCFRSQKEVSIYNVPCLYLIKALHGDSRRIELFDVASKFYVASEVGTLNQMETNLCWHKSLALQNLQLHCTEVLFTSFIGRM